MARELQPGDPQTIGPYRLVGQLGSGGMGRVFLGVSAGGRPVAVKVIRAELAADPEFRARFGREVAAARRVSGMFTATVVDADVDGTPAWLATAYVPGPSLSEAIADHGPLPPESLLTLAAGLAESLSAIHAAGVVHRDLKPANVLLAADGPRVIDFGISRAVESTALTQAGLVIGSPGYMSPEQAEGYDVGPPSDIFSLGAVLAFAATGEGPFGTGTTAALLYRVARGSPDLDRVPAGVRPLIERCLAKDPRQRPTAAGLLAEVGTLQPAADWLPESIIRAFAGDAAPGPAQVTGAMPLGADQFGEAVAQTTSASSAAATSASSAPQVPSGGGLLVAPAGSSQAAASGSMPPPPGAAKAPRGAHRRPPQGRGNGPRRRSWRPLALAWIIGFIVAAGAAAFAVTAFTGHTPTTIQSPAAQISASTAATSAGRAASGASAAPHATSSAGTSSLQGTSQSASTPASPSVYASKSPAVSVSPSRSRSATPTPTPSHS
ncbi:MAG TPA: serine/threonine-protein kinase, partial [Streptosporangiaceae bacterium]|nr:serine/threonine-protein kinase [Streptosporangiaceae bacterium]